jgi:hypothetical protein
MKKLKSLMLLAAMLLGFSVSVTSCFLNDNPVEETERITEIANQIWAFSQTHPDGFTLNIRTMEEPAEGIAVAYAATQGSHSRDALDDVVAHALANGGYVGGWLDTNDGLYYFDSVRLFPEDQLEAATEFAIQNDQLAFFVISTGTEIRLDGQARAVTPMKTRTYAPTWYTAERLHRWQHPFFEVTK